MLLSPLSVRAGGVCLRIDSSRGLECTEFKSRPADRRAQRQHGIGNSVAERRPLSAAAERALACSFDQKPDACARRGQRLSDR